MTDLWQIHVVMNMSILLISHFEHDVLIVTEHFFEWRVRVFLQVKKLWTKGGLQGLTLFGWIFNAPNVYHTASTWGT